MAIRSISASGNYAQTNMCGLSVKAGGSCTISVTFTPRVVGQANGQLTINDSDLTTTQRVSMSGTGIGTAKISLSPPSLYFAGHAVGSRSSKVVTLKNTGTATLTISKMAISGTNSADFKSATTCGSKPGNRR